MKLEQLRVFVTVAHAGELAEAGHRIGRTPAAVSMTLKQVESDVGGALFEGERKGRLTPLGAYVLTQAKRALAEYDNAVLNVRHFATGTQGLARIAAVPSAATRLVPPAIQALRAKRPGVRVDIRDIDSAAVADAVATGVVDFGIASLTEAASGLNAERLLEDPFVLVCPAAHCLTVLDRPLCWGDLDPNEFIANGLCARIDAPAVLDLVVSSPLTVRNTTSLLAFVEQGFGVTLLPALAVSASSLLRSLPLADRRATRKLDVLTRQGETLNPATHALLEEVRGAARALDAKLR
jgi:DNA-binding transcriptional LysR family regulator